MTRNREFYVEQMTNCWRFLIGPDGTNEDACYLARLIANAKRKGFDGEQISIEAKTKAEELGFLLDIIPYKEDE